MTVGGTLITGRARRADGSPVSEARVFFVTAPVPLPDIATLTDDDGQFSLYAPAPGRYELVCQADDFDAATFGIEVLEHSGSVELDIELGS